MTSSKRAAIAGFALAFLVLAACASVDERCFDPPSQLVAQLNLGFTAAGAGTEIKDIQVLKSDAGSGKFHFIAGQMTGAGLDEVGVWVTPSLDLDKEPLLLAVDFISAEFTIWNKPQGGSWDFGSDFRADIQSVKNCVRGVAP